MCRQGGFFMVKKRSLRGKINLFLCILLVFIMFPVFITSFFGRMEAEKWFFQKPEIAITEMEEKLPRIVAKQINIHMPEELIKAQCVIARTQLMAAQEKEETPRWMLFVCSRNTSGTRTIFSRLSRSNTRCY